MKDNTYCSAVEHLRFRKDLKERVLKAASARKPSFRLLRSVILAAVLCMLLASTVFAVGQWLDGVVKLESIGTNQPELSDARELEFTVDQDHQGVTMHYMEVDDLFNFRYGMMYLAQEGFFRVTEYFRLEKCESVRVSGSILKADITFFADLEYVRLEDGIVSEYVVYHPVQNEQTLVCAESADGQTWPVILNLDSGEIRDALPDFYPGDFEGELKHAEYFRGGILLQTMDIKNYGENEVADLYFYWVTEEGDVPIKMELPAHTNLWWIENNTIYYRGSNDQHYIMGEYGVFEELEGLYNIEDDLTKGLLTYRNMKGSLGIVDVISKKIYTVPDMQVELGEFDESVGYNATRHSYDGMIVVTHVVDDRENNCRKLVHLGFLDMETECFKLLEISSEYEYCGSGWLDDERFGVIYKEKNQKYLCIYEFE